MALNLDIFTDSATAPDPDASEALKSLNISQNFSDEAKGVIQAFRTRWRALFDTIEDARSLLKPKDDLIVIYEPDLESPSASRCKIYLNSQYEAYTNSSSPYPKQLMIIDLSETGVANCPAFIYMDTEMTYAANQNPLTLQENDHGHNCEDIDEANAFLSNFLHCLIAHSALTPTVIKQRASQLRAMRS